MVLIVKNPPTNAGDIRDAGSVPGWGPSQPEGKIGLPRASPRGFPFHTLEKEMATHSSVLAWRIPETEEPGRRPSMGSHRVGHN